MLTTTQFQAIGMRSFASAKRAWEWGKDRKMGGAGLTVGGAQ